MLFKQIIVIYLTLQCIIANDKVVVVDDDNDNDELLKLLILHNNDMHGRFEETSRTSGTCKSMTKSLKNHRKSLIDDNQCVGGFARLAHEIRKYRQLSNDNQLDGRKVLYLNAGDTYVGTTWFSVHKWKICADFIYLIKPDVMSLGNHEFDLGVSGLVPFVNNVKVPIVAANLDFTKEPTLQSIEKSVILKINNYKIGIIGHLTEDTKIISQTDNVIFHDVIESIRNESERLDRQGVKIIIVVGHSGYEIDKRIAKEIEFVDIVIGGHTNTFLWNGPQPDLEEPEDVYPKVINQDNGKKVPVVQAYAYTKYLGRLNVTFDKDGNLIEFDGQPELLDSKIPQDSDVLELLDQYRKDIDDLNKKVIGKSRVILDSTNNKCRKTECNFGNLVTDSFVYYMAILTTTNNWNNYPIALINGGAIRNTIDPFLFNGNITRGELIGAIPYESQIITFKMYGRDLIETLELGIRSNGETSMGEFLQMSGLHVIYDRSKPVGTRVVSVHVRCGDDCKVPIYKPIELDRIYGVISTSFLMNGGDGHTVLKEKSFDKQVQDLNSIDIVDFYISRQSPILTEEQGRIQFVQNKEITTSTSAKIPVLTGYFVVFVIVVKFVFN